MFLVRGKARSSRERNHSQATETSTCTLLLKVSKYFYSINLFSAVHFMHLDNKFTHDFHSWNQILIFFLLYHKMSK